jgi:DNA polymerase I
MEFDLYHGISLRPGTFNALLAPRTVVLPALNSTDKFRRSMILFTGSSPAGLLSAISGTSPGFDVQLAATAHQLRAVLSNAGHTIVFVEHDPLLYEGDDNLIRSTARALRDLAGTALVIL